MWALGEVTLDSRPEQPSVEPYPPRNHGEPVLIGLHRRETAVTEAPRMPASVHAAISAARLEEYLDFGDTGLTVASPNPPVGDAASSTLAVSPAPRQSLALQAAVEANRAREAFWPGNDSDALFDSSLAPTSTELVQRLRRRINHVGLSPVAATCTTLRICGRASGAIASR